MRKQPAAPGPTDEKRVGIIFGILLSGFMAVFFAGFFPLLALGFTMAWLSAWGMGVLIGWPLGFGLVAVVEKPLKTLAVRLARR